MSRRQALKIIDRLQDRGWADIKYKGEFYRIHVELDQEDDPVVSIDTLDVILGGRLVSAKSVMHLKREELKDIS